MLLCIVPGYSLPRYGTSISTVLVLDDTNFKTRTEDVTLFLGIVDLDLALRIDQSTSFQYNGRDVKKQDGLKHLSLMIMKREISEAFRGFV